MTPGDFLEQFPPLRRRTGRNRERRRMESLKTMTDAELVALTQEGNLSAFNQLAGRWESSLYGFVRRTLGDAEDARDVCQEALVKAFQNIARLRDGEKFKSWIHYIALNLCRDRFRSPRSRTELLSFDEGGVEEGAVADATGADGPDALTEHAALSETLQSVLAELPAEQRTSILLREFQGFTSEEIGEMTGAPAATVRTRIYYGLKSMRRILDERGIRLSDLT